MENFIFCAVGLIKARLLSLNIPMTSEVWVSESSLFLSIIAEEKKHFQKIMWCLQSSSEAAIGLSDTATEVI